MRLFIFIALFFLLMKTVSYSAEYVTITPKGDYMVLVDYYKTSDEQDKQLNYYVASWCNRNKSKTQKNMYYRIRNHIARITTYDNDGMQCYSAWGTIFNKRGVCMGYALLAKKFFDYKGIENQLIYDTDANHLFNRVCLDGNWQYTDITKFDVGLEGLLNGNRRKLTTEL